MLMHAGTSQMCLKPASDMAEAHAEGELRDQLADLEAQLQQIDEALEATGGVDPELETVRADLLESVEACRAALPPAGTVVAAAGNDNGAGSSTVRMGGTYRFRYVDQRSHLGLVTALRGDQAEVHFLRPTSTAMLAGVQLPASALQSAVFRQDDVSSLPPGSRVLAQINGPADGGVWHECQIVDFAAGGRRVTVRSSTADGATVTLPLAEVAVAHAAVRAGTEADAAADADSEDEDDATEDEEDDVEMHRNAHAAVAAPDVNQQNTEAEEEAPSPEAVERLHAALQDDAEAVQRAVQAGNWQGAVLAAFEQHTRGIGSKLLAAMGFVAGRGLGRDGKGIVAPVDVQPRRPGAGLGLVSEDGMRAGARKKRRGGERARRRKHAEAARAQKEAARDDAAASAAQDDGVPQLFSFLNRAVGDGSDAAAVRRRSSGEDKSARWVPIEWPASIKPVCEHTTRQMADRGYTVKAPPARASLTCDSRGSLAAQQDALTVLRRQVAQLHAMAGRNAKDKVLSQQISQRLAAATAQLASRESEHASSRKAINAQENQKRWTKF